jgi:putative tricarboxylic transport membrane protein
MTELLAAFAALANWPALAAIVAGSIAGIIVGVLPGLGPGVAIAVLLPLTYGMSPLVGITLLMGLYCGAFYGGAATSILIRTPGEASSIMTMFDGYPMAQKGEPQRALSLAFMSAFIGGIASAVLMAMTLALVAKFTSRFGAAEFAMTTILALVCVAKAYKGQFPVAAMMLGLGVFVGTIGIDMTSNEQRYTFGFTQVLTGVPLIPVIIGLFGVAQALVLLSTVPAEQANVTPMPSAGVSFKAFLEPFRFPATLTKSTAIGIVIGVLPAVGAALSTSLSYFEAKRSSADPDAFGKGSPEGIIAAEAANNSNSGGAMATVLALGIPGDAITAIIMGVFIVHGVYPGPLLLNDKPELVYGIFAALIAINVAILLSLIVLTRYLALFVRVDPRILGVVILALCFIGAYAVTTSLYSVWIALGAGALGWLCALLRLPVIPMALGLVLGDNLEATLRQALTISGGSAMIFVTHPIAAVITSVTVVFLMWPLIARGYGAVTKKLERSQM